MKAKIIEQVSNAQQPSGNKEMTDCWNGIVATKDGLHDAVTVRCYMSRASNASQVYACLWVNGKGIYTSGKGTASGYGYCKRSSAIGQAFRSAGIKLDKNISGVGLNAVEEAIKATIQALGYNGKSLVIHN